MVDNSARNGNQCYNEDELARGNLTLGEMGKDESGCVDFVVCAVISL